jgi:hypothetical protein
MKKETIYLSTISTDAPCVAREHSFGLELAEFCTAWNMDEKFIHVDSVVKKKLEGIPRSLLHAPYNELFPCAIDKKARALAAERYRQQGGDGFAAVFRVGRIRKNGGAVKSGVSRVASLRVDLHAFSQPLRIL